MLLGVLGNLFSLDTFFFMNLGLLIGIIFGSIPGLTTVLAVVLFTPMTFGLAPVPSMMLLLGIYCGGTYGGSITAILINTPGTPAASATVLDGYQLAKKGQAKKALEMALYASVIGGLFSAAVLLAAAPQVAKLTLLFGAPEYFALAFLGLCIIIGVSGDDLFVGIISGCIGLLVSTVGIDKTSGASRYSFGNINLTSGIELLILMIGIFAVVEVVNKCTKIYRAPGKAADTPREEVSLKDEEGLTGSEMKRCMKTIIRSSAIGTAIGAMPGTGAALSSFISYDMAKRNSPVAENFGKGELEGVAATEAGNNGATGATLIPLLTLGIPGDNVTAVMIGALTVQGLIPGPNLFTASGDKIYAIMFGLFLVNLFMLVQGKVILKYAVKISHLKDELLVPIILIFCASGAYAVRNSTFDLILVVLIGFAGYCMQRLKMPMLPLILGAVIGPIAEANFRRSLAMSQTGALIFITRPISAGFILAAVVLTGWTLYKRYKK